MRPRYESLAHTADIALRAYGKDMQELFGNAAFAMFSQMADLEKVPPTVRRPVEVRGYDYASLLVNWLNELLFLHETQGEVYSEVDIEALQPKQLSATVAGDHVEQVLTLIKAATFHGLEIEPDNDGYAATVVFDV